MEIVENYQAIDATFESLQEIVVQKIGQPLF